MKNSEIKLYIQLDEQNIPGKIEWEAADSNEPGIKECKSMLLSIWDKKDNVTLGIDLWTKEMFVDDMNKHFYQTFLKMADTYNSATNNFEVAEKIRNFAEEFSISTLDSNNKGINNEVS
ncbi:MAG: gliding motility protein GldC [Ignavibacteria bacterium]|jgi:gliding motility-associated protein GldC|nr:gliding motility protein GldC [Ignavibacteria bacterium]MDP3830747.1 gliding motility protein GldC [Ignavibacteriaceae bacterium]